MAKVNLVIGFFGLGLSLLVLISGEWGPDMYLWVSLFVLNLVVGVLGIRRGW